LLYSSYFAVSITFPAPSHFRLIIDVPTAVPLAVTK
jgi:hypothetical protein